MGDEMRKKMGLWGQRRKREIKEIGRERKMYETRVRNTLGVGMFSHYGSEYPHDAPLLSPRI